MCKKFIPDTQALLYSISYLLYSYIYHVHYYNIDSCQYLGIHYALNMPCFQDWNLLTFFCSSSWNTWAKLLYITIFKIGTKFNQLWYYVMLEILISITLCFIITFSQNRKLCSSIGHIFPHSRFYIDTYQNRKTPQLDNLQSNHSYSDSKGQYHYIPGFDNVHSSYCVSAIQKQCYW